MYYKWTVSNIERESHPDKSIYFSNEWVFLKDGKMSILPRYSWNGCSPKYSIMGLEIGTPDGAIDKATQKQMCYRASMFHDALYQFNIGSRKEADKIFLKLMPKFPLRHLYYFVVRILGWNSWNRHRRNAK